ncbi:MAG: 3-deoxy-D-manno-octulosonic acid kinase [Steroidobacteraceae bacterium]
MDEAAAAGEEALARGAGGAMLYDASCLHHPDTAVFDPAHWQAQGALETSRGGRGTVAFVRASRDQRWVLRHYRRGGLIAQLTDDRYVWTGADRTRSFREWRLLRQLRAWGLPVPTPVAARYQRAGLCYRADLLTAELPVRRTLTQALQQAPLPIAAWHAIGQCVGSLHARGVQHADLNAHNLLVGASNDIYVLDFDRGRIRARGAWERAVLARLRRSLQKVTTGLPADRFAEAHWQALLAGAGTG